MTDVSIVIPAYNEASKIAGDVEAAARFFEKEKFAGEIIVVDDGSTDGTSAAARAARVPAPVRLELIRSGRNEGKGSALKAGVLASSGDVVVLADSGTCVPYADGRPWVRRIRDGTRDVALASRRLRGTVILRDRSRTRRVLGRAFRWAAIAVVGLPRRITDPQCGFKIYAGDAARALFAGLETPGFLFELEIILKALRRGLRVEEFPMTWTCDPDTRVWPARQARTVVRELFAVRRVLRREDRRNPQ